MTAVPFLPKNAPFTAEDIDVLNQLVQRSTPLQRSWLSGFLAGLDAAQGQQGGAAVAPAAQAPRPRQPLTILYGSESGNTEALAMKAKKLAAKLSFDAKVVDMADADLAVIAKSKNLLVYISTWGEGDPPQRAADFHAALMADSAPRFEGVRFAVLALGDTAYVNFCQTGKQVDARLEALGGTRVADRQDLDLDFQKAAAAWTDKALEVFAPPAEAPATTVVHVDFKGAPSAEDDDEPRFTAENPIEAEITALINLNGTGSTRETWHVEFAVEDPGFIYKPGDAIGLYPENDPALAEDLLKAVGLAEDDALKQKLVKSFDITTLSRPLVDGYAKLTGRSEVAKLLEGDGLARFAADRQLIDLFETYPEKLAADQFVKLLRPLPGRLYSVASSPKAHPGEAHLLVGTVRWTSHGRARHGVTSTYLSDRRKVGDTARIYVKPNRHFGLPADGDRPIIMIGAGTGVAPYRGFIEERAETGAQGKSWLFFGERNFSNDFLYQLEWQDHLAAGALSRIDVAFSRDQPEKIYVQHRLWERREELSRWLDEGAHVYVCGDEKGMAKDVDATLVKILAEAAKGDEEAGRAKLKELTKAGRYQRDVY
ncbi:flavodoxin domain-containing protein [Hyphomicrobium sp.]|uniref:diflavin oxidoreductase n=1 Tax=Hyphomicrobium sp. TaxID=82 RepID=UPI0025C52296|nr:flavodoxin domain-containing protein [Hyphomicrobium sp.]MCC7250330.1 flavodoxin domain-containing protein [Hyphomicrobium sp.]